MGSMTENIADKAINDTRIVKQFTNPVKEPIDSDINLFDLLDNRAKRDPEGAMIEYKGDDCFASMFVRQVRQCFSVVWADGFPRCRHRFPVM